MSRTLKLFVSDYTATQHSDVQRNVTCEKMLSYFSYFISDLVDLSVLRIAVVNIRAKTRSYTQFFLKIKPNLSYT